MNITPFKIALMAVFCSFPVWGKSSPVKQKTLTKPVAVHSQIQGNAIPSAMSSEQDWEEEYAYLEKDIKRLAEGKFNMDRLPKEVLRAESLVSEEEKSPLDTLLRRTIALSAYLRDQSPDNEKLKELEGQVNAWKEKTKDINREDKGACISAFKELCKIRRQISFQNPLLDFDKMVFATHYSQRYGRGEVHMVDQYLGFNQKAGGGLYVLENPFSDNATAKPLFEDTPLANGRNQGKPLKDGSFISLELNYAADKLYFAWTQAQHTFPDDKADWSMQNWSFNDNRRRPPMFHQYYWEKERVFHIYSADLKTGELKQLTDGITNDYDPCELPNGRIVFISERANGNQRCGGRWITAGTLHSMLNDGSDLYPLSVHETNEWHPSVTNDGMIAYTRWDYVDRDDCQAHHLWTCYPDGSDPRSKHGNYSLVREARPFAELSIRAIPNSRKFVAVAGPHHGVSQGSLILIDQSVPDDGAMSQVKRLTPEAHFPESEYDPGFFKHYGGTQSEYYGTPWPLSEDFHLCIFARDQRHTGIYLVDSFGNRELIWKDEEVPCLDPIPFRPRVKPPIIPERTKQSAASRDGGKEPLPGEGEFVVLNVYDSEFPLPENVKIKWIRVVNIFTKTSPFKDEPMIGTSESLTRGSLGIVPVEEDGSAYFKAPVLTNLYFQLLDENKQAVHTMRSSTYLHPGERLSCIGCHENKFVTPENKDKRMVSALKRKPSEFTPEPKGAYPLTFPRLVQPVLDKHCVGCHAEKGKFPLDGNNFFITQKDGKEERHDVRHGWSNGYSHLFNYSWSRLGQNGAYHYNKQEPWSIPGQVGAQASKLLVMLEKGHQGVKLPAEDLYKITLWLDLNSNFYGDYTNTEDQLKGKLVWPKYGLPSKLPDYIKNQDPH